MKKLTRAFILTAMLLLALPALGLPFFGNQTNTEKRNLSDFPRLRTEEGLNRSFSVQLENWITEHIGFRSLMVAANSRLKAFLGESAEESVILGREGWLFYRETLKDYQKLPTISERGAACAARSLKLLADFSAKEGAVFVTALIPNKNSLYPAGMPANYRPAGENGNYGLLSAALKKEGVPEAPVREALAAQPEILYQKTDSHWTYQGALFGYRAIMETAGLPYERFEDLDFTPRRDWTADLAEALFGQSAETELQLYPEYAFTYEISSHETAPDAIRLETHREGGSGNAVIFRDSFCNTMQRYFAESFENVLFSRAVPYRADFIRDAAADLVVLELTERNIADLVTAAPVMEAPAAAFSGSMTPFSGGITAFSETKNGYLHLYGTLPEELLGSGYRVYLLAEEESGSRAYEAFPIAEAALLGLEKPADNGWSLYLPEDAVRELSACSLIIAADGGNYIGKLPCGKE